MNNTTNPLLQILFSDNVGLFHWRQITKQAPPFKVYLIRWVTNFKDINN